MKKWKPLTTQKKWKKKKTKKNESIAEKKKSSHKSDAETKVPETAMDNDESNKPPDGQEAIDDREFEKIFQGNYSSRRRLWYFEIVYKIIKKILQLTNAIHTQIQMTQMLNPVMNS